MKREDLTGRVFGRLKVLKLDTERTLESKTNKKYRTYWICKCDCGNVKSVDGGHLKNGNTVSCGCYNKEIASKRKFQDLTGQRFGMLKVLYLDESKTEEYRRSGKHKTYWVCECDCGTIRSFSVSNFKNGKTVSCVCYREQQVRNNFHDISGDRFGKLTAIKRCYVESNNEYVWECKCDCGNTTYVTLGNLISKYNPTRSCGCYKDEVLHTIRNDLTGQRFGRLLVVDIDTKRKELEDSNRTYWICKCDCGNVKSVGSSNLISENTMSCGCYSIEIKSGENSYLWNGGITELSHHMREKLKQWKMDSLKNSDYKCEITGSNKNLIVHHIYPFSKILTETLDELNLPINKNIGDYSYEELKLIEKTLVNNHYKYGYGAIITKDLHTEFHNTYGRGNYNTKAPEFDEWNEFLNNKIMC